MTNKKTEYNQEKIRKDQKVLLNQNSIIDMELYHKLMGTKINLTDINEKNMSINIIEEIKAKIKILSQKHKDTGLDFDDFKEAELIEQEVEQLIVKYCESKGYKVNGFPAEKRDLIEDEDDDDEEDDISEKYKLYVDTLATQKEDVAELTWCYVSSFWEDQFKNKKAYIQFLKENLDSGIYHNVKL